MSLSGTSLTVSSGGTLGGALTVGGGLTTGSISASGLVTASNGLTVSGGTLNVNVGSTFSVAPTMSGAGLGTGSINPAAISGTALTLTAAQTKTAGSITMLSGTSMTFNSGASLIVNGTITNSQPISGAATQLQVADSASTSSNCFFGMMPLGSYSLTSTASSQALQSDSAVFYNPASQTLTVPNIASTVAYTPLAGNVAAVSAPLTNNQYLALIPNLTGRSAVSSSTYLYYDNSGTGRLNAPALNIGNFAKTSYIGLSAGDSTVFAGQVSLTTSPLMPTTSTATTLSQLGFFTSGTVTLAGTGWTSFLLAGTTGVALSSSTYFGTYMCVFNMCASGMSSSNVFNVSIGATTTATQNTSCSTILTNAMATSGGVASCQLSYVFGWYSTSTKVYINVNSTATFTQTNSSYTLLRIA